MSEYRFKFGVKYGDRYLVEFEESLWLDVFPDYEEAEAIAKARGAILIEYRLAV